MPKYTNSIEQQLKLIELQKSYSHQLKIGRKMKANRMLAKSTYNLTVAIKNPFIRLYNKHFKQQRLVIDRKYLLKEYKKQQTFDIYQELEDNSKQGPQKQHYWLLCFSIGVMLGYYMCLMDNDHNYQQVYYWTRYPDIMMIYESIKNYKYSEQHQNSIYQNICYYGNLSQFQLNTQSGYYHFKTEIKELLFQAEKKQIQQQQKQQDRERLVQKDEEAVKQFEQFLEEQSDKLKQKI